MGFRKRKQQPQAFREESAFQRAAKDAAKEAARAPVVAAVSETDKVTRESGQDKEPE